MKIPGSFTLPMALAGFITVTTLSAADWPQWRGPNRDAKAEGFTAPKTWPKELNQKWKVPVGEGVSSPAVVGDRLYVMGRQEGNEITRCLEAATGKEVWQDKYESQGATGASQQHSGPRSSPAVVADKIYTLGVRGVLSCFDLAGKKLWRKDDFQGSYPQFYVASSPLVAGGLCVVQLGGQNNAAVVAYDAATGDQKWKWTGESSAYSSPVLMTVGGDKLVVALTVSRIVALKLADGTLVWETPFTVQGMRGYNAATPIVDGQTLIFTGSGRGTTAVKLEKDGDKFAAKDLWKNMDNSVQFNTPVLKGGLLYGLSDRNVLYCVNTQDGKTAWTAPFSPPAAAAEGGGGGGGGGRGRGMGGGGGYGSIVDAGSVLLALTPASQLVAFEPGDKAFTELARIKIAESATYAYPVVAGNRIFIKDRDSVALWTVEK